MQDDQNRPDAVLRRYHAAIEERDFRHIEAMFAPDAVYVSGGVGGRIEGREAILAAFRRYFEEFADQVSRDSSVEATGPDRAQAHWSLEATSSVTGKRSARSGIETVTLDRLGRIVRVDVEG